MLNPVRLVLYAVLLTAGTLSVNGQVILERGVLTGTTATAAGAAGKGTGKALSNIFGKVEKTLKGSEQPQPSPSAAIAKAETPAPPVKLPDVALITVGMTREDLLAKFGAPSQKMTIP